MESCNTKLLVQGDRQLPAEHIRAEQIYDSHKVNEPLGKTDIGDIRTPSLIWSGKFKALEQLRVLLMILCWLRQTRFQIDCLQAHQTHQTSHPFGVYAMALTS